MKQIHPIVAAAVCALAMFAGVASASSHREAPAISLDPAADNTDLWAWVKPGTHDRLYIVAAYNPFEEPSGGPSIYKFADEVLYEIHITRGDSLDDLVTYQFRFHTPDPAAVDPGNLSLGVGGGKEFFPQLSAGAGGGFTFQTMDVTKVQGGNATRVASNVRVAPPNIGPRTFSAVTKVQYQTTQTSYNDAFTQEFVTNMGTGGNEGTVWAGPRDDGFYMDLGGVFDLATLPGIGRTNPVDGVAGYNCHAIALDLPTMLFTANGGSPGNTPGNATTLGLWASASRRKVTILHRRGDESSYGPWVQVSRVGLPLVNEVVIGLQDKDKYNRTQPKDDMANFGAYFLNPVIVRDAQFLGVPLQAGVESNRTDILDVISLTNIPSTGAHSFTQLGDVLRVDMATDSSFPNGRPLVGGTNVEQADVTDVLLSLLLTKNLSGVSDGVNHNDANYLTRSPWLPLPWSGLDQGHGKPAP